MTKGAAWNILAKEFDLEAKHHILGKTNMVREFGEFLPDELKPKKKEKTISTANTPRPFFLIGYNHRIYAISKNIFKINNENNS